MFDFFIFIKYHNSLFSLFPDMLPISEEKFQDIQHLSSLCGQEAQTYFSSLKHEYK